MVCFPSLRNLALIAVLQPCGRRTRNKNLNEENLRKYRGTKVSKGRRNIRKQRYAYQPKDIVIFECKKYTVQGVQNKGEYIKLKEKSKPVKTNLVKAYMFSKGFIPPLL